MVTWVVHKLTFTDAVQYDEPKELGTREEVNQCDIALVAVPTDPLPDGSIGYVYCRVRA